jgi:putative flippase GtrA
MPLRPLAERRNLWQVGRYLISAGSMALLYLGILAFGLFLGWQYFLAILLAQAITISIAFPVYRKFVFQSHGPVWHDFGRFLSVWAAGAIAGLVATPLLVQFANFNPLIAQVLVVAVVSVGSFLSHRLFSFRKRAPKVEAPEFSTQAAHNKGDS